MQHEWNARTQITMWFDNTEDEASLLRDYGKGKNQVFISSNQRQKGLSGPVV